MDRLFSELRKAEVMAIRRPEERQGEGGKIECPRDAANVVAGALLVDLVREVDSRRVQRQDALQTVAIARDALAVDLEDLATREP